MGIVSDFYLLVKAIQIEEYLEEVSTEIDEIWKHEREHQEMIRYGSIFNR